jgi:ornithine cyclodeaminase/alanine dehydrogenase-like protein (mu-crystallin family)
MERKLSLEVVPAETPREALAGADVALEASNTAVPVFSGQWLEPGMHVTSIAGSNRELTAQQGVVRKAMDEETVRRSNVIFVNLKEQIRQDQQGEIFQCIQKGLLTWERIFEIGDLVAGRVKGRDSESEITFYNNNAGMGVVDVGLAAHVYRLAVDNGLGKEI